jgi:hypothetical protein
MQIFNNPIRMDKVSKFLSLKVKRKEVLCLIIMFISFKAMIPKEVSLSLEDLISFFK